MVILAYFTMCLIFGTTFLAIKVGIDAGSPPFFSAGIRFFIAGLLLFIWMLGKKRIHFSLLLRRELALIGIGLTFGTFSTLYWAEKSIPSGMAAILSATGPIFILLFQNFFQKKKISGMSFYGCLFACAGVGLLFLPSFHFEAGIFGLLGCAAVLLGEFFFAGGTLYSKHVMPRFQNIPPLALNSVQMMYGGILLLLVSILTEHPQMDTFFSVKASGSLIYLIIAGSMTGHSLYYWLVVKTNPIFPSTWLFVSPVIAMAVGTMLYHEPFSWVMGIGTSTILMGVILVNGETLMNIFSRLRKIKVYTKLR